MHLRNHLALWEQPLHLCQLPSHFNLTGRYLRNSELASTSYDQSKSPAEPPGTLTSTFAPVQFLIFDFFALLLALLVIVTVTNKDWLIA